jgi:transcriptional regulator with XRE-family HTH domain
LAQVLGAHHSPTWISNAVYGALRMKNRVNPNKIIGANIRALRKAAEISQTELGQKLGIHQTAICRVERGTQQLSAIEMLKICDIVSCRMFQLYLGLTVEDGEIALAPIDEILAEGRVA